MVHPVIATNFRFLSCQLYATTFSPQPPPCTRRSIIPELMLPLSFNFWSQFQLMLQGMGAGRKKSTFLTKTLSDEYSYSGERFPPPQTFSLFTHSPNAVGLIMPLGHCMQKKDYNWIPYFDGQGKRKADRQTGLKGWIGLVWLSAHSTYNYPAMIFIYLFSVPTRQRENLVLI